MTSVAPAVHGANVSTYLGMMKVLHPMISPRGCHGFEHDHEVYVYVCIFLKMYACAMCILLSIPSDHYLERKQS